MDVEGEEEALIPAMITNGALCDLSTIVMERHPHGRSKAGKAVGLRVRKMEGMFSKLQKANSRCHVQFVHQDDETYRMLMASQSAVQISPRSTVDLWSTNGLLVS
jgi:hypothetical protein